jgi:hypothetical protein
MEREREVVLVVMIGVARSVVLPQLPLSTSSVSLIDWRS